MTEETSSILPTSEALANTEARLKTLLQPSKKSRKGGLESLPADAEVFTPDSTSSVRERARQRLRTNPPEAVTRRLRRIGIGATQSESGLERAIALESGSTESSPASHTDIALGLERIIGRNELLGVQYLDGGQMAARSVGRIVVRLSPTKMVPMGTGFLVGQGLFLTNNHVLPTPKSAQGGIVEFNYQCGVDGKLLTSVPFELSPETFFLTSNSTEFDFTLIALRSSKTESNLADFGFLPLASLSDEVLDGESVTIIQHASGDPKQIALRENFVLSLPNTEDRYLYYQTDTTPGSSGSPVFNDDWEVVALHHSGFPRRDANRNILTRDGRLWTEEMGENEIDWIANEGIRIGAIVKYLQTAPGLEEPQRQLLSGFLKPIVPPVAPKVTTISTPAIKELVQPQEAIAEVPIVSSPRETVSSNSRSFAAGAGNADVIINIPGLYVSARIGGPTITPVTPIVPSEAGALEKVEIDTDYRDREGYDPKFLGSGNHSVPMPKMTESMIRAAAVNGLPLKGAPIFELPYHHYSVVFNKKRQLAFFTAVNIDGTLQQDLGKRENDRWIRDSRIGAELQIGNEWYKKPFDRGHLVRRLDPAWGRTETLAKTANDDTFHFTNCSPQHSRFNQGKSLWQGLENYLLDTVNKEDRKLSLFTGPIFEDGDPEQNGVKIPKRFWKVAAFLRADGTMGSCGFIVSQEELLAAIGLESTAEQVARTFQVQITEIEQLTNLDFGRLRTLDTFQRKKSPLEGAETVPVELDSLDQIQL